MIRTSVLSLLQCNFVDPLQRNPRSLVTHLGWTLENQQHHLPFKINQERNFIISSKKQKLFPDFFFCCILIFLFVKFAVRRPGLAAVCRRWLPVSGQAEDTQLSRSAPSCCYHFYTFTLTIFSTGISVCKAVQRMTCHMSRAVTRP